MTNWLTVSVTCEHRGQGTDAPPSATQAYLDWEYGLVEQLERDATHGFFVI